jgi:photosystem II stability/assembly factor-like uncharacterized protein
MQKKFLLIASILSLSAVPNASAQWMPMNALPNAGNGDIDVLGVAGTTLFASTYTGFFRSTDSGSNWSAVNSGLPNPCFVEAFAVIGENIFIATVQGNIFRSTDNGTSWDTVNHGLPPSRGYPVASGPNLFVIYNDSIYLSKDSGHSWTPMGLMPTTNHLVAVVGTTLFAWYNSVFRTTDNGASWTLINLNFQKPTDITCFAGLNEHIFAGTSRGLFQSTDSGASWTADTTGIGDINILALDVVGVNLFASSEGKTFLSTNSGTSWISVSSGLPNVSITEFAVINTNIFVGALDFDGVHAGGVWRRPLSEMIDQSAVQERSGNTNTFSSYPNPLSQSTTISYTPKASGYAEISIINLLGVEVARIFSGELESGGHSFTWSNTSGLPDGIYECIVRMNGRIEKLPMVVLR